MGDDSWPDPQRVERDGLPLWWADAPGPFTAALMVRAGRADETLPRSGIAHLAEHLLLYGVGRPRHDFNGFVDPLRTLFYASGTPEQVVAFFAALGRAIAEPPFDRLEDERRILRTESAGDAGSFYGRLMNLRFGAAGHGLLNYYELGLEWLGPDEISGWLAERFTRGNAGLWMSGPVPDAFRLELPDGPRMPPPELRPVPGIAYPSHVGQGTGGVGLAMTGRRSTALSCALRIAAERAHHGLRLDLGLSYAVNSSYDPLDRDTAHVLLGADCLDEHAGPVRDELLTILRGLAEGGAEQDELDLDHQRYRDALADPEAVRGALDYRLTGELCGETTEETAALVEEHRALTPAALAEALTAAMETLMVVAPPAVRPAEGFTPYGDATHERLEGREHRPRGKIRRPSVRIHAADAGLSYVGEDGEPITVRYDACAAAVRESPDTLTVIGDDGSTIEIARRAWADGDELIAAVEAGVPRERIVPGPRYAQSQAVAKLAETTFGRGSKFLLSEELAALPDLLFDGEQPEALARADKGWKVGLLVLTDRRVLFLYGDEEPQWEQPRDRVQASASTGVPGLRDSRISLHADGEEFRLKSVRPREAGTEIAAALS